MSAVSNIRNYSIIISKQCSLNSNNSFATISLYNDGFPETGKAQSHTVYNLYAIGYHIITTIDYLVFHHVSSLNNLFI